MENRLSGIQAEGSRETRKQKRTTDEAGIYTNPVVSPAVPPDRSLLRTTIMATHSEEDLDRVLDTFEKIGKQMEII